MQKTCVKCNILKDETQFATKSLKTPDKTCKECRRKLQSERNKIDKEKLEKLEKENPNLYEQIMEKRRSKGRDNYWATPIRQRLLDHARRRAKKKNLEFNLELEDIPEVPEFCPVLPHIKLNCNRGSYKEMYNSPTLDRKNNNFGYVKGNIFIISHKANDIKSNGTPQEILMVYHYSMAGEA